MAIRRERQTVHIMDRLLLRPVGEWIANRARDLAMMHRGSINAYSAYVLIAVLLALAAGLSEIILSR